MYRIALEDSVPSGILPHVVAEVTITGSSLSQPTTGRRRRLQTPELAENPKRISWNQISSEEEEERKEASEVQCRLVQL